MIANINTNNFITFDNFWSYINLNMVTKIVRRNNEDSEMTDLVDVYILGTKEPITFEVCDTDELENHLQIKSID